MTAGRTFFALLMCSLAGLLAQAGAASAASVRFGHPPRLPHGAHAAGALPDQTRLLVTIALAPSDAAGLATYAHDVSTPSSPLYRHYLSVTEFAQRFGATPQQIDEIRASLQAHGLRPGPVSANGLSIPVSPTAAQARHAFSIGLERYALSSGRTAYANTSAPALDPGVARLTQAVVGLDTLAAPQPLDAHPQSVSEPDGVALSPSVVTGGPQPCAQAKGVGGAFTADQLASAYGFSGLYAQHDLGAGQTIALYELESYKTSDITSYQSCYGTSTSVSNISVDSATTGTNAGQGEAALDIEDLIGLAPAAKILVYTGPNQNAGPFDTLLKIVTDNQAQVVSTSWGLCEADVGLNYAAAENVLYQEAATQGQSWVAATGDDGSEACTDVSGNSVGGPAVSDPSVQPYVTAAGGTRLGSLGPPPGESVWNDSHGATGGGISQFWTMPGYQSAAPASLNVIAADSSASVCGASTFCREIPDVSADAAPSTGYAIFFNGAWRAFGGTSASAPLWGALLALTNASPACAGTPVGFANPALYRTAGAEFATAFNDVTSGNNDFTLKGGFAARAGYDMATGLGTPIGGALSAALCDRVTIADPGDQLSLAGTAASVGISATSSGGSPITYRATGLPAGLSINPGTGAITGTLAGPASTTVTIDATAADGATAATSFGWVVRAATVKLAQPRSQNSMLGKPVTVQLSATVDNGQAPAYSASGLPLGLSLDPQSGLVTGTPRKLGQFSVTVIAGDLTGASATARFSWTIGHALTVSQLRLAGVGRRQPKLSFTISAPKHAAVIKTIAISLPPGLSFTGAHRGIALHGHAHFSLAVKHGVLTIKVSKPLSSVKLVLSGAALSASKALANRVGHHQVGTLPLTLTVADAHRLATRLAVSVKP